MGRTKRALRIVLCGIAALAAIGGTARPAGQARVAEAQAPDVPARNVRITVTYSSELLEDRARGAGASSSRSTSQTRQDLVVLSGGRASLRIAEEVPYADWFWTWGQREGLWPAQSFQWRDVGTSLAVEPFVLDDHTIRLRVTPEFSYYVDRDRRVSRVQQLSTEVVVRAGEEIDLGGLRMSNQEFEERFLRRVGRSGRTERIQIKLRARVEP